MADVSTVNTETGGNYSGIKPDPTLTSGYGQYLDSLLEAMQVPKISPLSSDQYYPSAGKSAVIGQVSNKTMGSLPIFGSSIPLFPQAILDQQAKAKREAEIEYLNTLNKEAEASELKLNAAKLKNAFSDEQFSNQLMQAQDTWLEEYARRTGGNYMEARILLNRDRDYQKMMQSYASYSNIYNAVAERAAEVLTAGPGEVDETLRKEADEFLSGNYNIAVDPVTAREGAMTIDVLAKKAEKFKTHISVYDIAKNLTAGIKEQTTTKLIEDIAAGKDMESSVYRKITTTGVSDEDVADLYKFALDSYPWLEDGSPDAILLKKQLKLGVKNAIEQEFELIKRDMASTGAYLKKSGVAVDENGDVITKPITTGFIQNDKGGLGTGVNGIKYPNLDQDGKEVTIPTLSGTGVYVRDKEGQLRYVRLPGSFEMKPRAEYDLYKPKGFNAVTPTAGWQGKDGRYVDGVVNIMQEQTYAPEETVAAKNPKGQQIIKNGIAVQVPTGERAKAQTEQVPLVVKDELTGETISLIGTYEILVPMAAVQDNLHQRLPFLVRAHNRLPQESKSAPTTTPEYADNLAKEPVTEKTYTVNGEEWTEGELRAGGWTDKDIARLNGGRVPGQQKAGDIKDIIDSVK